MNDRHPPTLEAAILAAFFHACRRAAAEATAVRSEPLPTRVHGTVRHIWFHEFPKGTHNVHGWRMDGIVRPSLRLPGMTYRHAVKYNAAECRMLAAEYEAGSRIDDIAAWHQRSSGAIISQLVRLGMIVHNHYEQT